jgi:glutamate synthase (NADPH/NADH) small chain
MQGCPLGNQIPEFNELVYRQRWREAVVRLSSTNSFPEFTGRLCPAPCEAACVLNIDQPPVTIEQIEKEIIERAFAEGWIKAEPPRARSGFNVAVVGSGPAGLAAAAQLNRAGHRVTVFERDDRIGGLLRYGIPDFKLEKWVLDRRLELLAAEGVQFAPGTDDGGAVPFDELKAKYDALVIAIGSRTPRDLPVPGRELAGVHFAMEFLGQQNRRVAGDAEAAAPIHATGKHVIILGGGDTGSDCLGTSLRHGAASVRQIELLPQPPAERAGDNPWPGWPIIMRTSSSHEEGGERDFALMTKRLLGEQGRVTQLEAVRVAVSRGPGGRLAFDEVAGSETALPCDLLLLAMGYIGPQAEGLASQLSVALDARGNVATKGFATSVAGVFAAGDAQRGQSLIVWAISDGRECARAVDEWLTGRPSLLPTRGADCGW